MASSSTYNDHNGGEVTFWDYKSDLDSDRLRIEITKGDHCDMPIKLLRQLVCEHDHQVVDRTHQLMSNPPRYPTACSKCGHTSSISCSKANMPKLVACTHALDGVIYTTCPRVIHGTIGPPCKDCIDE